QRRVLLYGSGRGGGKDPEERRRRVLSEALEMSRLSLGDLVDLEARILEERGEPEEVRRTRYRQLGRRLAEKGPLPEDPAALLPQALLRSAPRPDAPGRRFGTALRLLHTLLSLLGLLCGGSLTLGLLQNSAGQPVNILAVFAALIGTQLLLLTILLIALLPR